MLKIAIDIMGGDNSPKEPICGIKSYIKENCDKNIFLTFVQPYDGFQQNVVFSAFRNIFQCS